MLPYSETFIAAQGLHLPNWKVVFAGATEDRSGLNLLKGAKTCTLTNEVPRWKRGIAAFAFKRFGSIPALWVERLQTFKPSLIHVHFGPDALFMGIPLAKALGIPLVVTFHGFDITINDPQSRYQRERGRLFEHASRVIAVSDFIAEQLVKQGCPIEKIVRHYIGIDLQKFKPIEGYFERKDVVFVGRLTEKKGCRYLIDAMLKIATESKTNHHLHIIGDGTLKAELELQARPLGDRVVFHGRQDPDFVRTMMGRAAVFCAPSVTSRSGDAEGLGMVNLEAMAMRTPVVSTFHTAIPEAVIHEETGILVREADSGALAAALNRCLEQRDFACELGAKGLIHVRRNFDVRRQCAALETIYEASVNAGVT